MQVTAMPKPSATIHEPICAGVAPAASAAWKTRTAELVKPTRTATKPATSGGSQEESTPPPPGGRRDDRSNPATGPECGAPSLPASLSEAIVRPVVEAADYGPLAGAAMAPAPLRRRRRDRPYAGP